MDFANTPSFFRQGPRPLVRLISCATLSVALLVADSRYGLMEPAREALSVVLYPLQWAVNAPVSGVRDLSSFFTTQSELQQENAKLRTAALSNAAQLGRLATVERELTELKALAQIASSRTDVAAQAEVLYTGRDAFTYKLIIDRGTNAGLKGGMPVLDGHGLLGQITRVQPLTAEVTLVVDKNQMVPVMIERTGQRAILYGYGGGVELRYMPIHADIKEGDRLVTSGIDSVFPPGVPVAQVGKVDRNAGAAFARVACIPYAGVQSSRYVLVVSEKSMPPAPAPAQPVVPLDAKAAKAAAKAAKKGEGKDAKTKSTAKAATPASGPR
ncbi:rod shape-determining protein MreC [Crenobacter sp. SG2303]|uniref:Cell shape-determining protein MreC n=1 Tax=Crenobacter oryzisoli TaxID=3056844 RepID=A0ABT7XMQ9_9NEIS|nr:rod shape-determining protein MreC [Crenobacter sp. SG2303]MDN0075020.1 rod shape-determining protein MreC [Crenobacter sp. SG2303]